MPVGRVVAVSKAKALATISVPRTHLERIRYVDDHPGRISVAYAKLKDASEDARYDLIRLTRAESELLHDRYFLRLKAHLESVGFGWDSLEPVPKSVEEKN